MLARIVAPTEGELVLRGEPVDLKSRRDLAYAAAVQLVLQDPFASINPVRKVAYPLERALTIHGTEKADLARRCEELLTSVSLTPPADFLARFPHELSGGQLQRINIARGLAVNPQVLLADEPISMLDVSVRLGILNLLRALCDERQLAMLYITHDIASARYIADETAVMYAGQVVERARGTAIIDAPQHPYTQLLVASVPNPDHLHHSHSHATETGTASTGFNTNGCRFSPRCPVALDLCHANVPPEVEVDADHMVRCWLVASDADRQAVAIGQKPTA
jgi:peptide/nickel transport system ATP-binding protein